MLDLKQALSIFNYQVVGGSEYLWKCWPNARYMDFESEHAYGSIVLCSRTQTIYEANVSAREGDIAYRWLNPEWSAVHAAESKSRGVDVKIAWDNVKWVDLDLVEDFDQKASTLWRGEIPDSRVLVPIDLDDSEFLHLARLAHQRDITINQMVEVVLREAISKEESVMAQEAENKVYSTIVHENSDGELYIELEPEVLERAGLSIGDSVEWVDKGNGVWALVKVEKS